MRDAIACQIQHGAFRLALRVACSPANHLLPQAAAQGVAIQYNKIDARHVHAFCKDRVIAHDLDLPFSKAFEQLGPKFWICSPVDAGRWYARAF